MSLRRLSLAAALVAVTVGLGVPTVHAQSPGAVCAPMRDEGTQMCLDPDDAMPLGSRIPVLLIHGWTFDRPGPPRPAVWDNFTDYSAGVPWVREKYKFYRVTYYSNVASVTDIGRILAELVDGMDARDPAFAGQNMVIVGHSLGGLVARSFMQEWRLQKGLGAPGGDRVLRLVTLGTPHHGTPLANGPARDDKAGSFATLLAVFDAVVFRNMPWSEANRSDIHADRELSARASIDYTRFPGDQNPWLDALNANNPYWPKISMYAGSIRAGESWDRGCLAMANPLLLTPATVMDCTALMVNQLFGDLSNDGIVPVLSAAFKACDTCVAETLPGYDHFQIAQGKAPGDSILFDALLTNLSEVAAGR
jgi:pimeloyl-ACP methyl ester carboxylesterase